MLDALKLISIIVFTQNVDFNISTLCSPIIAKGALKGPLPGVRPNVTLQVTCLLESVSTTEGTLEYLGFTTASAEGPGDAALFATNT